MKKTKLTLDRVTIKPLQQADLQRVVGGLSGAWFCLTERCESAACPSMNIENTCYPWPDPK